jgi:hypothetical protein
MASSAGRKPLSAWDDVVKQWKARGRDAIAKEYEQSLECSG